METLVIWIFLCLQCLRNQLFVKSEQVFRPWCLMICKRLYLITRDFIKPCSGHTRHCLRLHISTHTYKIHHTRLWTHLRTPLIYSANIIPRISRQLTLRDAHVRIWRRIPRYWPWAEILTYKFSFMDEGITGALTFIWTYDSARKQ